MALPPWRIAALRNFAVRWRRRNFRCPPFSGCPWSSCRNMGSSAGQMVMLAGNMVILLGKNGTKTWNLQNVTRKNVAIHGFSWHKWGCHHQHMVILLGTEKTKRDFTRKSWDFTRKTLGLYWQSLAYAKLGINSSFNPWDFTEWWQFTNLKWTRIPSGKLTVCYWKWP